MNIFPRITTLFTKNSRLFRIILDNGVDCILVSYLYIKVIYYNTLIRKKINMLSYYSTIKPLFLFTRQMNIDILNRIIFRIPQQVHIYSSYVWFYNDTVDSLAYKKYHYSLLLFEVFNFFSLEDLSKFYSTARNVACRERLAEILSKVT